MNYKKLEEYRDDISELVKKFSDLKYSNNKFDPENSVIPPSGKLLGFEEINNMVMASLDGWLTTGRFNDQFEIRLAEFQIDH